MAVETADSSHLDRSQIFLMVNRFKQQENDTIRFYLTPVRIANMNKTNDQKCWYKSGERGRLIHC